MIKLITKRNSLLKDNKNNDASDVSVNVNGPRAAKHTFT